MLVEHRVDDMDESFVAVEEPVATGQQVSLEPSLALVLGEHLDNPSVGSQMIVVGEDLRLPGPIGHFEDVLKPVRGRFVRTEDPESLWVGTYDIAKNGPSTLVASGERSPASKLRRQVAEVGEFQVGPEETTVGMRVGTHSSLTG